MKYIYILTDKGVKIIDDLIEDYFITRYDGEMIYGEDFVYWKTNKALFCDNKEFNRLFQWDTYSEVVVERRGCTPEYYEEVLLDAKKTKPMNIAKPLIGLAMIAIGYGIWEMKK